MRPVYVPRLIAFHNADEESRWRRTWQRAWDFVIQQSQALPPCCVATGPAEARPCARPCRRARHEKEGFCISSPLLMKLAGFFFHCARRMFFPDRLFSLSAFLCKQSASTCLSEVSRTSSSGAQSCHRKSAEPGRQSLRDRGAGRHSFKSARSFC